jgi:hypothetical protein
MSNFVLATAGASLAQVETQQPSKLEWVTESESECPLAASKTYPVIAVQSLEFSPVTAEQKSR